jgi:hypothetical protein
MILRTLAHRDSAWQIGFDNQSLRRKRDCSVRLLISGTEDHNKRGIIVSGIHAGSSGICCISADSSVVLPGSICSDSIAGK